jgi:Ca2+-binding RTX toxin-like protein
MTLLLVLAAGALAVPAAPAQAQVATCDFLPVTISGTSGADHITGTPGNDVIAAGAGNDRVTGLGGNDVVCLGPGNDSFSGGAGNDRVVAEAIVDGADGFDGGSGVDTARYLARTSAVDVSLDGVADDGAAGEGDNNHADVENIDGAQVGSRLRGNDANNVLNGSAGNDTILGVGGSDLIRGGPGTDTISPGAGDDFVVGGTGNDTVIAAIAAVDGADWFDGGVGVDTASYSARTTAVNVSLDGIANDGAPGEDDNNLTTVENVARNTVVRSTLFGGQGNDILIVNDNGSGDTVNGSFGVDLCAADPGDTKISCEI